MIQIKRGKTASWKKLKTKLRDGQPGFDKDKHKLKIGDGEHLWADLPYATGLFAEEILDSERAAKEKFLSDSESRTIITYGTDSPDKNTVGQIYLQQYDAEPEVDYVVSYGINGIWTYRKWHSGIAECWGTTTVNTAIQSAFEGVALYHNDTPMTSVDYPILFTKTPTENASVQSPAGIVLLTGRNKNNESHSATYNLISTDKLDTSVYYVTLNVKGRWR